MIIRTFYSKKFDKTTLPSNNIENKKKITLEKVRII